MTVRQLKNKLDLLPVEFLDKYINIHINNQDPIVSDIEIYSVSNPDYNIKLVVAVPL